MFAGLRARAKSQCLSLYVRVACGTPNFSAHHAMQPDSPLNVMILLLLMLRCCSFALRQRQLALSYPASESIRSIVVPSGRSPMSRKNASNELRHSSQTSIPRPPYLSKFGADGLWQREIMFTHVLYVGEVVVFVVWLCLVFLCFAAQLLLQKLPFAARLGDVLAMNSIPQTRQMRDSRCDFMSFIIQNKATGTIY